MKDTIITQSIIFTIFLIVFVGFSFIIFLISEIYNYIKTSFKIRKEKNNENRKIDTRENS